jgi:hypothetical protein
LSPFNKLLDNDKREQEEKNQNQGLGRRAGINEEKNFLQKV